MDVLLNEDEEMLKTSAREFFEQECPTSLVRAMEEDEHGCATDLWRKIAALGWLGFGLPQSYGGENAPLEQVGLLMEEMGRAVAPLPFLSTIVPALTIAEAGTESQRQEILPRVARGERILTWALTERDPRATPDTLHTQAELDGEHYVLSGSKLFVDNFNVADQCLLVCRTAQSSATSEGISLLLLDTNSQGVSHTLLPTLAGDKQSEVTLRQVRVPKANLVGEEHQAWPLVERLLERATALSCAQIVGATRKAVDMAIEYAKWRVAFGRPIGAFQSIQHMCADMVTWVDGAQLLTYEALWKLGQGLPAGTEVATAKAFCNERCQAALRHANQIHAGVAQIKEFDLNLWYRRAAAWTMKLGTTFEHRRRIAQAMPVHG
jgi:alkylation response protein AidB-like acyl-CoA dehydrogenase